MPVGASLASIGSRNHSSASDIALKVQYSTTPLFFYFVRIE